MDAKKEKIFMRCAIELSRNFSSALGAENKLRKIFVFFGFH